MTPHMDKWGAKTRPEMPHDTRHLAALSQIPESEQARNSLLVPVSSIPMIRNEVLLARPPTIIPQLEDRKAELMKKLYPYVPAEAVEILFDAGYETIDAINNLNIDQSDPTNDLSSAESYTKRTLKPGHKKLIAQYVSNYQFHSDCGDISPPNDAHLPAYLNLNRNPASFHRSAQPDATPSLQPLLEKLRESLITKSLSPGIDYTVNIERSRTNNILVGVWKCMICSSRPVMIPLQGHKKYPQLSNVGTHLKTMRHRNALAKRNITDVRREQG